MNFHEAFQEELFRQYSHEFCKSFISDMQSIGHLGEDAPRLGKIFTCRTPLGNPRLGFDTGWESSGPNSIYRSTSHYDITKSFIKEDFRYRAEVLSIYNTEVTRNEILIQDSRETSEVGLYLRERLIGKSDFTGENLTKADTLLMNILGYLDKKPKQKMTWKEKRAWQNPYKNLNKENLSKDEIWLLAKIIENIDEVVNELKTTGTVTMFDTEQVKETQQTAESSPEPQPEPENRYTRIAGKINDLHEELLSYQINGSTEIPPHDAVDLFNDGIGYLIKAKEVAEAEYKRRGLAIDINNQRIKKLENGSGNQLDFDAQKEV